MPRHQRNRITKALGDYGAIISEEMGLAAYDGVPRLFELNNLFTFVTAENSEFAPSKTCELRMTLGSVEQKMLHKL